MFDADSTLNDVATAGENVPVALYRGSKERASTVSVTTNTRGRRVQPQNLPPTSAAARYHSFRVFLQVKKWQGPG